MAETIEADDESWTEVIVTLAISTTTSLLFLTTYEIARRHPTLNLEVFDRRRVTKPNQTPPPLLRNSILEWMFVSNDWTYSEYADLAHMRDVIMEKRKQRREASGNNYGSGGGGSMGGSWFGWLLGSGSGSGSGSSSGSGSQKGDGSPRGTVSANSSPRSADDDEEVRMSYMCLCDLTTCMLIQPE